MRQFIGGIIVGAVMTASLGLAGNLYDRQGQPAAPRGSVQQFDYFRQRQQQLDVGAMRRQMEQDRVNKAANPCAK